MDHRQQYRQAQLDLIDVLNDLKDEDLDKPTICSEWTVRGVMRHIIGNHYGRVATAAGREYDPDTDARLDNDPREEFPRAADAAWEVDQRDEVLEGTIDFGGAERPAWVPLSFQFADTLIHIWDIGRALSRPVTLRPELVGEALKVSELIPVGDEFRGPGKPFGKIVPTNSTRDQDRLLALTGRDPEWTP